MIEDEESMLITCGFATLVDIDECSDMIDSCDSNAGCTNVPGTYTCSCNSGYTGDGMNCTSEYEIGWVQNYGQSAKNI